MDQTGESGCNVGLRGKLAATRLRKAFQHVQKVGRITVTRP
jgi:hypothetical protein